MRCLAVQQPYAWAIGAGLKYIENRSWTTDYRGPIAIHASRDNYHWKRICEDAGQLKDHSESFARGAIIGIAHLVDIHVLDQPLEENRWALGPHCWLLNNARLIQNPIFTRGRQGLYQLDTDIEDQLLRQLELPPLTVNSQLAHQLEPHLKGDLENQRYYQLGSYEELGDAAGAARIERKLGRRLTEPSLLTRITETLERLATGGQSVLGDPPSAPESA